MELTQEQVAKVVYASIIMTIKDFRDTESGEQYNIGFPSSITIEDDTYVFKKLKKEDQCH